MRLLSIITNSVFLFVLQQLLGVWFMVDFFLARESSALHSTKKSNDLIHFDDETFADESQRAAKKILNDLKRKYCDPANGTRGPIFDKTILIVIDALGSNFIPSLRNIDGNIPQMNMPFIEGLLHEKKAMGFVARAATPTVTMPRIKALMSGSIPSFADILYNLAKDIASVESDHDNLLDIARLRNKSIVFYGDDTWLSLYNRDTFLRSRETLSLFASDYISVDTNVTERALPETKRDVIDWDYMILHYLGLDHIGHSFNSNTVPLIYKKLKEMDDVAKEIYENMMNHRHKTLIIICGDHGMSREGNHGGDSDLESSTAMLFLPINTKAESRHDNSNPTGRILQIDLATTISTLTGLPSPTVSRGIPIRTLLEDIFKTESDNPSKDLACVAVSNLMHLMGFITDKSFFDRSLSQSISALPELSRSRKGSELHVIDSCFKLAKIIQEHLVSTIAAKSNSWLISASLIATMILTLFNLRRSCIKLYVPLMMPNERILCLLIGLVPMVMQISTDYIELEHYFWPIFSLVTFVVFLIAALSTRDRTEILKSIDRSRISVFCIASTFHYLWNNCDSFRTNPGWFMPTFSLFVFCNNSKQNSALNKRAPIATGLMFFSLGLFLYYTKIREQDTTIDDQELFITTASLQILSFMLVSSSTFVNVWALYNSDEFSVASLIHKLAISWTWFAFLLSRMRNFPFLLMNVLLEASVNSIANSFHLSLISRCLTYLQFSTCAFYNQGNTNLFSSIDIKPAFFGQTQYNFMLSAPIVACATYSSQVYWYLKLFQRVQGDKEQQRMCIDGRLSRGKENQMRDLRTGTRDFIDMLNFLTFAFYMFVCIVLRNHLFVWSVLSPKLVYHWMGTMIVLRATTLIISTVPPWTMRCLARDAHERRLETETMTVNV